MNRLLLLAVAATFCMSACSKEETAKPVTPTPVSTTAPQSGKIVQILQAGGYTYAEVDAGGQKIWIAGGPLQVKEGDSVQWGQFALMRNFASKSLNRTFEQILFVDSWGPVGGAAAQVAPHGTMPGAPAANPHAGIPGAPGANPHAAMPGSPAGMQPTAAPGPASSEGQVKTVTTAGGYSYVEVVQANATVWVAAPETVVKVGDKVRWAGGAMMHNFTAKSLGRTFEQIVFASALTVVK